MTHERKTMIWSISAIVVAVLVFFWYIVFGKGNLLHGNNLDVYIAQWSYVKLMLREGLLPLWSPYTYSGTPAHADVQMLYFYPLQLLLLVFSPVAVLGWSAIVHFCVAGIGMYFYLRAFKLCNSAALFGSFAFMFSGFLVTYVQVIIISNSAAWIPWVMLCSHKAWEHKDLRWTVPGGVAYAMCFLAGHTQIYYYLGLLLGLEAIWRLGSLWCRTRCALKPLPCSFIATSQSLNQILIPVSIVLISIALSAIQFFPTAQLSVYTAREGGIAIETAQYGHWTPKHLLTTFNPLALGTDTRSANLGKAHETTYTGTVGILVLLLSAYAIWKKRDAQTLFFATVAVLSVVLAMGPITPLYGLLYNYLPFFSTFRAPTKITVLLCFALATLGAFGFHHLSRKSIFRLRGPWFGGHTNGILIFLFIPLLLCELWFWGISYNYRPANPAPPSLPTREEFQTMGKTLGHGRMLTHPPVSNFSALHRIENVWGYSILFLDHYAKVAQPIAMLEALDSPQLDFLNIKYMKLHTQDSKGKAKLFENTDALPRAFIAENYPLEELPPLPAPNSNVVITKYTEDHLELTASLERPGTLVTSEVWYPGWKAKVNGNPAEILKTNTAFRALTLPAGTHRVSMKYRPISFHIGRAVSLLSLMVLIGSIVQWKRSQRT